MTKALTLALAHLKASGLDAEDMKRAGMEPLDAKQTEARYKGRKVCSLLIRYYTADGKLRKDVERIRLLEDQPGAFGELPEKPLRYIQSEGSPPAAYFPKGTPVDWPAVLAAKTPILISEGEKKALVACKHGIPCIGLGGVSNWRTAKLGWSLLPELAAINWDQRPVVICFDSDAAKNPNVSGQLGSLVTELASRGARPSVAELPEVEEGKKCGLDDFIVARGIDAFKDVLNLSQEDELTTKLWEFNKRFAYIIYPGLIYEDKTGYHYEPGKFQNATFANVTATKKIVTDDGVRSKIVPVAEEWIKFGLRRQYAALTYAPGRERVVSGDLNIWNGWAIEPKKGDLSPWHKLLDRLFQGADEASRKWFERWCLWPIAHPGAKMINAVGIWSRVHGVGKSSVGDIMERIYGEAYRMITQKEFEGNFNEWAKHRQFVMVDDISAFDSRHKADILKSLISRKTYTVNIKYVPEYKLPEIINYYLTSNHADSFYLEDEDRRFFIHEVVAPKMTMKESEALYKWRDGDGPAALLHYAQDGYDFGGFNPYDAPPKTLAKSEMIRAGKGELDGWIADLLEQPDAWLQLGRMAMSRDIWTSAELLALFEPHCKGRPQTSVHMGMRLRAAGVPYAAGGALIRAGDHAERFFIVRDRKRWTSAPTSEIVKHIRDCRTKESGGKGKF